MLRLDRTPPDSQRDRQRRAPMLRAGAPLSAFLSGAIIAASPVPLTAQSTRDLAAFSALMVSPAAALPPLATDNGTATPDRSNLAISYGRWRYDIDDAIHHNVGATITRRIASSRTSVSFTGAYLSASCDCSGWGSAGVSILSQLWSSALTGGPPSRTSMHVGLNLAAGVARYAGAGAASAYSAAGELDVAGSTSFVGGTRLALSVFPGFGMGHLNSADATATGTRPMMGAAAAWTFRRGLALDLGAERVILKGGPTQFGAGISWRAR
jgi:hypothetical protein